MAALLVGAKAAVDIKNKVKARDDSECMSNGRLQVAAMHNSTDVKDKVRARST